MMRYWKCIRMSGKNMTDKEIIFNCARQEFNKYKAIQSNDDNNISDKYIAYIKSIGLSDFFDLLKNNGFDLDEK